MSKSELKLDPPDEITKKPLGIGESSGKRFRVFSGIHAGADLALLLDRWYLVGAEDDCDIILRDSGVAAHHCLIAAFEQGFRVRVLDLLLVAGSQRLQSGDSATLEDFDLCTVGPVKFAIGSDSAVSWHELQIYADSVPLVSLDTPYSSTELKGGGFTHSEPGSIEASVETIAQLSESRKAASSGSSRISVAFKISSVLMIALVVGAYSWWSVSYSSNSYTDVARLNKIVSELGLSEVSVVQTPNGYLELRGAIPTDSQRIVLLEKLAQLGVHPLVNVASGERLALSVEDVFRQRGLNVRAAYLGSGRIDLSGIGPSEKATEIINQIIATGGGIRQIAFVESEAEAPSLARTERSAAVPTISGTLDSKSDRKRITAVVGGDEPFLVTADGGRYSTGAIMPDNSVIESIDSDVVTFRRGNEKITVKF